MHIRFHEAAPFTPSKANYLPTSKFPDLIGIFAPPRYIGMAFSKYFPPDNCQALNMSFQQRSLCAKLSHRFGDRQEIHYIRLPWIQLIVFSMRWLQKAR